LLPRFRRGNGAILYQEDFEGTGWANGDALETVGAGPITWQKTTGWDSVEVTNTHGSVVAAVSSTSAAVPEPSSIILLGIALGAFAGWPFFDVASR